MPSVDSEHKELITPYRYFGNCTHVVDGDTMDVELDLGFNISRELRIRLLGVNTAELPSYIYFPHISIDNLDPEKYADALGHLRFAEVWFEEAERRAPGEWSVIVETHKDGRGKYGRYLGDFWRPTECGEWVEPMSLTNALIDEYGNSVLYGSLLPSSRPL